MLDCVCSAWIAIHFAKKSMEDRYCTALKCWTAGTTLGNFRSGVKVEGKGNTSEAS